MDSLRFNVAISTLAHTLYNKLSADDFELLSILFTQLGASMTSITALHTLRSGGVFPFQDDAAGAAISEESAVTRGGGARSAPGAGGNT